MVYILALQTYFAKQISMVIGKAHVEPHTSQQIYFLTIMVNNSYS